ncbi:hypothetical protein ACQ4PT_004793 [Festuca glaucescens]
MSTKRASASPNLDSPVPGTSAKRLRACGGYTATTLLVPVDLLLEIAVRFDAATIVRCAAVSKPLRASILDPGFHRRLALRGFDPSLLRAISYKLEADGVMRVVQTSATSSEPNPVRSKPASLCCCEPVAWRDGIAVFRHNSYSCGQNHADVIVDNRRSLTERLTVCNSITGHTVSLPPVAVGENHYPPALLTVDDNFELLVADKDLGTPSLLVPGRRVECHPCSPPRRASTTQAAASPKQTPRGHRTHRPLAMRPGLVPQPRGSPCPANRGSGRRHCTGDRDGAAAGLRQPNEWLQEQRRDHAGCFGGWH